jgi:hypothetical protein
MYHGASSCRFDDSGGRSNYKARRNASRSCFSCAVRRVPRMRLKNSTVSSSVSRRPSCRYGGESLIPHSGNVLIGPSALAISPLDHRGLVEAFCTEVVHQVLGEMLKKSGELIFLE